MTRVSTNVIRTVLTAFIAVTSVISQNALAETPAAKPTVLQKPITTKEKAINYGLVFGAQIVSYYATQREVIEEHGSFENWVEHPSSPHFDKDSFDFNLVKHGFVGQYYYLFYRSRGYEERSAFYWAFLSSLTFEFAIETVTEKPSFQDLYQTPVFGTILGMGTERLSDYFHSVDTVPTTILAYLLNPFTLLPGAKCNCGIIPMVGTKGEAGVVARLNF